jgi:hypothetical protein
MRGSVKASGMAPEHHSEILLSYGSPPMINMSQPAREITSYQTVESIKEPKKSTRISCQESSAKKMSKALAEI